MIPKLMDKKNSMVASSMPKESWEVESGSYPAREIDLWIVKNTNKLVTYNGGVYSILNIAEQNQSSSNTRYIMAIDLSTGQTVKMMEYNK